MVVSWGRNGPVYALCPNFPEAVVPLEGQLRFTRGHGFPGVEKASDLRYQNLRTMGNGWCLNGTKKKGKSTNKNKIKNKNE